MRATHTADEENAINWSGGWKENYEENLQSFFFSWRLALAFGLEPTAACNPTACGRSQNIRQIYFVIFNGKWVRKIWSKMHMCNECICVGKWSWIFACPLPDGLCTRSPVCSSTNMSGGKCVQRWVLMRACVRMYVCVCLPACLPAYLRVCLSVYVGTKAMRRTSFWREQIRHVRMYIFNCIKEA